MNLGIIGLGLIGGSFGLAARTTIPKVNRFGSDHNVEHEKEALSLSLVDELLTQQWLPKMDVVVVAVPVDQANGLLLDLLDKVNDNCLVMDVGSTKASLCQALELHPKRNQFLATHPIAGTEFSGPKAAFDTLFEKQIQMVCETQKTRPDLLEWALQWFRNMKMEIREMDPIAHDKHIAYVSHLSHISSFMLGKTVLEKEKDEKTIFDMAGSGFASTVRLAKSSPKMWTPIFKHNQKNILDVLTHYIENLERFKTYLKKEEYDKLYEELEQANTIAPILNGILNKQ
ncbi:MAG: prephenate dehydrogenase [Flavobacteriaceae bacterium]